MMHENTLFIAFHIFVPDVRPLSLEKMSAITTLASGNPLRTPLLFQSQNLVKAVSNPLRVVHVSKFHHFALCRDSHLKHEGASEHCRKEDDVPAEKGASGRSDGPIKCMEDLLVDTTSDLINALISCSSISCFI